MHAGNGLGAPQSLAAVLASATPYPGRKNALSGPCGPSRPAFPDAGALVDWCKSHLRALKAGIQGTAGGAALAADPAAPDSLIHEPKVGKPNNHAGSKGGRQ